MTAATKLFRKVTARIDYLSYASLVIALAVTLGIAVSLAVAFAFTVTCILPAINKGRVPRGFVEWKRNRPPGDLSVSESSPALEEKGPGRQPISVTVIIPSFNSELFLSRSVESALASEGVDVAVIVVDDASTDSSWKIAKGLAAKNPNISLIRNPVRQGPFYSRNLGLVQAKTEFVAFLDSDDVQAPDRLEKQTRPLVEDSNLVATYCQLRRWDRDLRQSLTEPQLGYITPVFRKSLVQEVGFFDTVRFGGDGEFEERLTGRFGRKRIKILKEELYFAIHNPSGLTGSGLSAMREFKKGRLERVHNEHRAEYARAFREWHASEPNLFMAFPLFSRPFPAPSAVTGEKGRMALAADITAPGGLGANTRQFDFVLGVTTYNRLAYLIGFLESFLITKSHKHRWLLIVADDGSEDGTQDFVRNWIEHSAIPTILIENNRLGIAGQTNSILWLSQFFDFELGFKSDDDIVFRKSGWDLNYSKAYRESGFDHLVFHDPHYSAADVHYADELVEARVGVEQSLGAFWTFTPRLLENIGYFDEQEFSVRGYAHWDFSARACRAGFNNHTALRDLRGANTFLGIRDREGYLHSVEWSDSDIQRVTSREERERRLGLVRDSSRLHVSYLPRDPAGSNISTNVVKIPSKPFLPQSQPSKIPPGFVINLDKRPDRWRTVSIELEAAGLKFERFVGTDGTKNPTLAEWQSYDSEGLVLDREKELGRRLLDSPGALGYLKGVGNLIAEVERRRLESFILFDDDVVAHSQARAFVDAVFSEVPANWKLIYLGHRLTSWTDTKLCSSHLIGSPKLPYGSFAVAIHRSAFSILQKEITKFSAPFDDQPLRSVFEAFPDETFLAYPPIFVPRVEESMIRGPRKIEELAVAAKWRLRDYPRL